MRILLLLSFVLFTAPALADSPSDQQTPAITYCTRPADCPQGLVFSSGDWLLACNNLGDCAAVGYHPGRTGHTGHPPVSVLIHRLAGAGKPAQTLLKVEPPAPENMQMNGQPIRPGLLLSLVRSQPDRPITISGGGKTWTLSTRGAAEVLAKMDAFQGHSGTATALLHPGQRHYRIDAPVTRPTIRRPLPPVGQPRTSDSEALRRLLRDSLAASGLAPYGCQRLDHSNHPGQPVPLFTLYPLDQNIVLAEVYCSYGNGSRLFAAVSSDLQRLIAWAPVSNDTDAEYAHGRIRARHSEGEFGECYRQLEYVWTDRGFDVSGLGISGLCGKGSMSYTWDTLPLFETNVVFD